MESNENKWWYYGDFFGYLKYGSGKQGDKCHYVISERNDNYKCITEDPTRNCKFKGLEWEATTEQIERILGGYAKQMGYKEGVTVRWDDHHPVTLIPHTEMYWLKYQFRMGPIELFNTNDLKWAEIVKPEPDPQDQHVEDLNKAYHSKPDDTVENIKLEFDVEKEVDNDINLVLPEPNPWTCPICNRGVRGDVETCNHQND